jgi:hypothetical protein
MRENVPHRVTLPRREQSTSNDKHDRAPTADLREEPGTSRSKFLIVLFSLLDWEGNGAAGRLIVLVDWVANSE